MEALLPFAFQGLTTVATLRALCHWGVDACDRAIAKHHHSPKG